MSTDNQPIRFSLEFTPEIAKYIQESKSPSIKGFAARIKVSEGTLWAWANKKLKDKNGQLTEQLARPKFHEALVGLKELQSVKKANGLNDKQELFCQYYAMDEESFANGTKAYIKAYNLDVSNGTGGARASASQLLTNPNILARIRAIMELGNFNDEFVDKELQFVIAQRMDLGAKTAAIREYNKLKQRITDKIDHTTNGKSLPTPIYGGKSTEA